MVKLTEEMVVARTRISDLSSIRKLNCWGADLSDVSLIRKMPNVEVLALSVNQVTTLVDFQNCSKLQELYIRKNNISDLREVCYLKDLPHLRNLWLADNPCAEIEGYRLTVLRALPQLQRLDDVVVNPEEIKDAIKFGRELTLPSENDDDNYDSQESLQSNDSLPSPITTQKEIVSRKTSEVGVPNEKISPTVPPPDSLEPNHTSHQEEFVQTRRIEHESPKRRFSAMTINNNPIQEKPVMSESAPSSRRSSVAVTSTTPIVEHVVTTYSNASTPPIEHNQQSRCPVHNPSYSMMTGSQDSTPSPADNVAYNPPPGIPPSPIVVPPPLSIQQSDSYNAPSINEQRPYYYQERPYRMMSDILPQRNYTPGYQPSPYHPSHSIPTHYTPPQGTNNERISPTRPVGRARNRASNLLMAALCLVNELDYASLEVLSMAVRNRLDELDD